MALKAVAFRVILRVKEAVSEHEVKGTSIKLALPVDKKLERQAYTEGTVVDIGPDAWAAYRPSLPFAGLKEGDRVFYAKYSGKWIADPETGEELLIVNDEDIVAKVGI